MEKTRYFGRDAFLIELYDNSFLIDSGVFVNRRRGSSSVSIEFLLESYAFAPEKASYQRIHGLKRKIENGEKPKEKISADAVEKYTSHPYVQRCTSNHFTLKKQFYDKSLIVISYPIDEILGIFEIDESDFPLRVRNKIIKKLISWNGDSGDMVVEYDQEFGCGIQHNRMRGLERLLMMHFDSIRKCPPSLTSEQKWS